MIYPSIVKSDHKHDVIRNVNDPKASETRWLKLTIAIPIICNINLLLFESQIAKTLVTTPFQKKCYWQKKHN